MKTDILLHRLATYVKPTFSLQSNLTIATGFDYGTGYMCFAEGTIVPFPLLHMCIEIYLN